MEFLLRCWDELDDLAGLCRHLARIALAHVGAVRLPLPAQSDSCGAADPAARSRVAPVVARCQAPEAVRLSI